MSSAVLPANPTTARLLFYFLGQLEQRAAATLSPAMAGGVWGAWQLFDQIFDCFVVMVVPRAAHPTGSPEILVEMTICQPGGERPVTDPLIAGKLKSISHWVFNDAQGADDVIGSVLVTVIAVRQAVGYIQRERRIP